MRVFKSFFLILVCFLGLSPNKVVASDGPDLILDTSDRLSIARHHIIFSKSPVPGKGLAELAEEHGTMKANEASVATFLELIAAIVGADGKFTDQEREYSLAIVREDASKRISDSAAITRIMAYTEELIGKARRGEYKGLDARALHALVEKHAKNLRELEVGGEDILNNAKRSVLCEGIAVARIDGFSEAEKSAARELARQLLISDADFDLIDNYTDLVTRFHLNKALGRDPEFRGLLSVFEGKIAGVMMERNGRVIVKSKGGCAIL